jgi:hypothetical protein
MSKRTFRLLLLACVATGTLWAADDPFVGDWKLNPSKSKLTDEMKVENLGGNKYSFDFGGGSPETIVVDGTDQPGNFGTTFAVTAVAPDEWRGARKKDGRVLLRGIWKLSKDGNTLHDDFTAIGASGSTTHLIYVYQHKGEGSGFAGTWVSTSEQVTTAYVIQVRPYEGDGLSFNSAAEGVTKNVKFDGKDYANVGPDVAKGVYIVGAPSERAHYGSDRQDQRQGRRDRGDRSFRGRQEPDDHCAHGGTKRPERPCVRSGVEERAGDYMPSWGWNIMFRVTRTGGGIPVVFAILLVPASFARAASKVQTFVLSDTKEKISR